MSTSFQPGVGNEDNHTPYGPPPAVVITDNRLIRATTPPKILASLERDAQAALAQNPDMACTVIARWPVSGPRRGIVVLYSGHENPSDDGLVSWAFSGDPTAAEANVQRMIQFILGSGDYTEGAR